MSANPTFDPNHPRAYRVPLTLRQDGKSNADNVLSWTRQAIVEGESFLRGLSMYNDIEPAMEFMTGIVPDKLKSNLSHIKINHIKNDVREMAEILSNIRPGWSFESQNQTFIRQTTISNALHKAWFSDCFVDRKIHEAIVWAATTGTGFISPYWNPTFHKDTGLGDVDLRVFGPKNFLPVQLPRSGDIQGCYAGGILETLTLHECYEKFPDKAHLINPTRSARSGLGGRIMDQMRTILPFALGTGSKRGSSLDTTPVVDVYYWYIDDTTVNNTGQSIAMGQPGSSWYYEVPSYQSDIPNGRSADGQQLFRKATESDSRLYPGRRLVIATDTCILYDGPNYFWHGQIPIVKFALVEWPWEPLLGQSLIRNTWSIQASLTSHYRALDDKASAGIRPAMMIDESVGQAEAEAFDPRQAGQKIRGDLKSGGDLAKPILDATYYQVPQWIISEHIPFLRQEIKEGIGLPGLQDMMKLRQMPASESLDKLEELASPVAQGMSRTMERPIKELGDLTNSMRYQFYTLPRRLRILGKDGFTEEDFDYEPGTLVPSHMPQEDPQTASRYSIYQRGRWFSSQIWMHVTPLSLHQISQTSRKLLYLQLWRGQFPIDPMSVAEALDLPGWGNIKGDTMLERWQNFQAMMQALQAQAAQVQAAAQQEAMLNSVMGGGGSSGQGAPGSRPPGSPSTEGRPASGHASPHIEQKSGGRTTVAES